MENTQEKHATNMGKKTFEMNVTPSIHPSIALKI
jgi:hypothetical protein